jgi:hypothetical protein
MHTMMYQSGYVKMHQVQGLTLVDQMELSAYLLESQQVQGTKVTSSLDGITLSHLIPMILLSYGGL